jgi:hypothetical protein
MPLRTLKIVLLEITLLQPPEGVIPPTGMSPMILSSTIAPPLPGKFLVRYCNWDRA